MIYCSYYLVKVCVLSSDFVYSHKSSLPQASKNCFSYLLFNGRVSYF